MAGTSYDAARHEVLLDAHSALGTCRRAHTLSAGLRTSACRRPSACTSCCRCAAPVVMHCANGPCCPRTSCLAMPQTRLPAVTQRLAVSLCSHPCLLRFVGPICLHCGMQSRFVAPLTRVGGDPAAHPEAGVRAAAADSGVSRSTLPAGGHAGRAARAAHQHPAGESAVPGRRRCKRPGLWGAPRSDSHAALDWCARTWHPTMDAADSSL